VFVYVLLLAAFANNSRAIAIKQDFSVCMCVSMCYWVGQKPIGPLSYCNEAPVAVGPDKQRAEKSLFARRFDKILFVIANAHTHTRAYTYKCIMALLHRRWFIRTTFCRVSAGESRSMYNMRMGTGSSRAPAEHIIIACGADCIFCPTASALPLEISLSVNSALIYSDVSVADMEMR
jgi:hypothetical protein